MRFNRQKVAYSGRKRVNFPRIFVSLHPRRVHPREEKSDEKTQSDARRQVRREEPEGGVRECAREGAERDQTARAHDIRQVEERTEERPRDEAELHGQRQPTRA